MEVTQMGVTLHDVSDLYGIKQLIMKLYGEQPLKYFNEYKRLKVIHLKTGIIKDATLDVSCF